MSEKKNTRSKWFAVDSALWQEPGPLKLDWPTRKLAIYLREAAGVHDDGDEVRSHVVLRSEKRIMQDLKLSKRVLQNSIKKLQSWPSRRQRFIQSYDPQTSYFALRELLPVKGGPRFVRVYRWFWEAAGIPDTIKDILLFTKTRFEGKDGSDELFSMSIKGMKQPSILRCCYIKAMGGPERLKMVRGVVKLLTKTGLVVVKRWSTSRSPMVVTICDSIPSETVSKTLLARRVTSEPFSSHQQSSLESPADLSLVTSEDISSHHTSDPVSYPEAHSSSSDPAPVAERQGGVEEPSRMEIAFEEASKIMEELERSKWGSSCSETVSEPETVSESETVSEPDPEYVALLAPAQREIIKEVERNCLGLQPSRAIQHVPDGLDCLFGDFPNLRTSDLLAVLESDEFANLRSLSWGLIFSNEKYFSRFTKKLRAVIHDRRESEDRLRESQSEVLNGLASSDLQKRSQAVSALVLTLAENQNSLLQLLVSEENGELFRDAAARLVFLDEPRSEVFDIIRERSSHFSSVIRVDLDYFLTLEKR